MRVSMGPPGTIPETVLARSSSPYRRFTRAQALVPPAREAREDHQSGGEQPCGGRQGHRGRVIPNHIQCGKIAGGDRQSHPGACERVIGIGREPRPVPQIASRIRIEGIDDRTAPIDGKIVPPRSGAEQVKH